MECKSEHDMMQIELYVKDVAEAANLFLSVFDLALLEEKPGWRHLRHAANYDIMLFAPDVCSQGESHWKMAELGMGGVGIEVVLCTTDIHNKRNQTMALGYECSALRYPPWGSTEFFFRLPEGYLFRIKQPASGDTAAFSNELDAGKEHS
jgi:hypothetical protein